MPYINLNAIEHEERPSCPADWDGVHFAHSAVQFAALGIIAEEKKWNLPRYHLYAIAIELALKSLALRSGAQPEECRKSSHRISEMIALIERYGTTVPERTKTWLSDDWFRNFLLLTRYPVMSRLGTSEDNTIFLHSDYPGIIAEILEAPCKWPLEFVNGSAMAEIRSAPAGPMMIAKKTTVRGDTGG